MDRITLKEYAKKRISGKRVEIWKGIIFLFLGNMVISFILPTNNLISDYATQSYVSQSDLLAFMRTSLFVSLITIFLLQPLEIGVNQYLMDFDKNDYGENNTLFAPYKKIFKIFVLKVFITIVCALPLIILFVISFMIHLSSQLILPVVFIGILANFVISYFYAAVPYIFNDMQENSIIEIMKTSRIMMKGHKFEFFVLTLSFLGWDILSIFTCGILMIWVFPYMCFTYAKYFLDLKESYYGIKKTETESESTNDSYMNA